jgi:hypothetical protein
MNDFMLVGCDSGDTRFFLFTVVPCSVVSLKWTAQSSMSGKSNRRFRGVPLCLFQEFSLSFGLS